MRPRQETTTPNKKRKVAGFTLVEATVAILVFGLGVIVLMQLAPKATQGSIRARQLSSANSHALAKMEELRELDSTHADLAAGTHTDPDNPIDGAYRVSWEVVLDEPMTGMRRVEVTVSFDTQSADSMSTLLTYF